MRNVNIGTVFFIIFIAMMLSNVLPNIGFFFPFLIFFFIANGVSKSRNQKKKSGHVRESTRRRRAEVRDQQQRRRRDYDRRRTTTRATRPSRPAPPKNNPFKKSGKDKFNDFDYDGAIEDFSKALQINDKDPATHFNLACAYSLTEQKDLAFQALSNAFALGFNDIERVKTHDALAYLRVQDEFDAFMAGKYQWPLTGDSGPQPANVQNSELLQQLKQLADLREKGLLTDEEFLMQKKRLLR